MNPLCRESSPRNGLRQCCFCCGHSAKIGLPAADISRPLTSLPLSSRPYERRHSARDSNIRNCASRRRFCGRSSIIPRSSRCATWFRNLCGFHHRTDAARFSCAPEVASVDTGDHVRPASIRISCKSGSVAGRNPSSLANRIVPCGGSLRRPGPRLLLGILLMGRCPTSVGLTFAFNPNAAAKYRKGADPQDPRPAWLSRASGLVREPPSRPWPGRG